MQKNIIKIYNWKYVSQSMTSDLERRTLALVKQNLKNQEK